MEAVVKKVDHEDSQDAYVFATIAVARVKLDLSDLDGARKDLDTAERILDNFDSVESVVHAAFYDTNAKYFQAKSDWGSYYKNALLYLACIDVKSLSLEEQRQRAYNLAIAALVSSSIYNFGELLLHPILESLNTTSHSRLRELLFAFNAGDLNAYQILTAHSNKNRLLKNHQNFLYQKLSLSALTETVFRRPPQDRTLSFASISEETKVKMRTQ